MKVLILLSMFLFSTVSFSQVYSHGYIESNLVESILSNTQTKQKNCNNPNWSQTRKARCCSRNYNTCSGAERLIVSDFTSTGCDCVIVDPDH